MSTPNYCKRTLLKMKKLRELSLLITQIGCYKRAKSSLIKSSIGFGAQNDKLNLFLLIFLTSLFFQGADEYFLMSTGE